MADARMIADIDIQVKAKGAKDSAVQITKVGKALDKAGMSVKSFTEAMNKTALHPKKLDQMSEASNKLYRSLKEQAQGFGLSGQRATRYAQELATVHDSAQTVANTLLRDETAAKQLADAFVAATSTEERFTARVNGAILVLNGETTALQQVATTANGTSLAIEETAVAEDKLDGEVAKTGAAVLLTNSKFGKLIKTLGKLATISTTISGVFKKLASSLRSLSRVSTTTASTLRRMYSTMRALMFTALIFFGVFKEWFEISSEFAEVNHMLYTVSASLHQGARSVAVLTDGTIEFAEAMSVVDEVTGKVVDQIDSLSGTEENLQHLVRATDMFGNKLSQALYYDDAEVARKFQSTIDYLDEIAYKMELDPTALKQTYAQFLGMAQSAGIATDNANALALGVTELTYDLASLWDVPFETAAQRMRSALAGITRAVQQFGLDVSRASMDAWLLDHGINANYASLSRADKMMAIYLKMMENTDAAQGDLARSALQPANLLRFLGEQARLAARQLGGALFPIFTAIIPLFIRAAQAVQTFAASLATFLGGRLGGWYKDAVENWNSYLANLGSGLDEQTWATDLEDDTDDVSSGFASAAKNAKDFKKQLLGFDEINNLTEKEDTSGGGSGGIGAGAIDWAGMFNMDDIWSRWDGDVRTQIDKAAADIKTALIDAFDLKFGEGEWSRVHEAFKSIGAALFDVGVYGDAVRTKFENMGITVTPVLEDLRNKWGAFKDLIGLSNGTVGDFAEGFAAGFLTVVGWIQRAIDKVLELANTIKSALGIESTSGGVGKFAGALAAILPVLAPIVTLLSKIGPILKAFGGPVGWILLVVGELFTNSERLRDSILPFLESIGHLLEGFITGLGSLLEALQPVFEVLGDALAWIIEGLTDIFNWLGDIFSQADFSEVGPAIKQVWDDIVGWFNTKIEDVKTAWNDFVAFLDMGAHFLLDVILFPIKPIIAAVDWLLGVLGLKTKTAFADEIGDTEEGTGKINDIVEGLGDKIGTGVGTFFHDLVFVTIPKKLGELWNELNTTVAGWPDELKIIGSMLIHGLLTGILLNWDKLKERVSGLFGGLVTGLKQKLGIASPSKVFAEMGKFSMEGFGVGFEAETTQTINRVINTTDNMLQAVTQEVIGVSTLNGNQMNNLAQSIGTSVTVQANAALQSQDNDLLASSQAEIGLLREQNNLLTQLVEKEFGISLDGKQLADSINRASRIQGRPLIYA